MGQLISAFLRTVRRNVLLFLGIVLILASGSWLRGEWKSIQGIVAELPSLQSSLNETDEYQATLVRKLTQQLRQFSDATLQQLDARIRLLDSEMRDLQNAQDKESIAMLVFGGANALPEQLARTAKRKIEIELYRQERDYLIILRERIGALLNREGATRKLEQLRLAHVKAYAALQSALQQQAAIGELTRLYAKIPFTHAHDEVEKLDIELRNLRAANEKAHQDFLAQQALVDQLPRPTEAPMFRVNEQRLAAAGAALRERLVRAEQLAAQNHIWRAFQAVRPLIPIALGVLLGSWLVPLGIRALFYFVLAPAAEHLSPIVIGMPNGTCSFSPAYAPSPGNDGSLISAVSQRITLDPYEEMLIRPDYCQSQPAGVTATTKVLFNWRHWLPSIASHMWMLKRLRTARPAEIVVSSTVDPLDEIALLEIAPRQAFVLQARGLVGVVYKTGQRPRIRSHWRLATLHAWLTLQLRYLSFEGPATLIVKGCRGVRLENASVGRTISQDATLGFSANTVYSTVRAEPFIPYLRGKQALLHDKFAGHDAYYLYEEIPRNTRPGQQRHNPFEVLLDAGLKAFGI
jgi:hypothetical protein